MGEIRLENCCVRRRCCALQGASTAGGGRGTGSAVQASTATRCGIAAARMHARGGAPVSMAGWCCSSCCFLCAVFSVLVLHHSAPRSNGVAPASLRAEGPWGGAAAARARHTRDAAAAGRDRKTPLPVSRQRDIKRGSESKKKKRKEGKARKENTMRARVSGARVAGACRVHVHSQRSIHSRQHTPRVSPSTHLPHSSLSTGVYSVELCSGGYADHRSCARKQPSRVRVQWIDGDS